MLAIARADGQPYVAPTVSTTLDRTYPIARPLYLFTIGEPLPPTRRYIEWILSDEGQAIVGRVGYVPLRQAGGPPS
jgi:phosphate transport system substrate-binding protein